MVYRKVIFLKTHEQDPKNVPFSTQEQSPALILPDPDTHSGLTAKWKQSKSPWVPPPSSIKSIPYSWSSRGTQEQWWLNDAMAGKEKGWEEAKAPGQPSCTASQGCLSGPHLSCGPDYHTVSFNGKTQRILRWVREALRWHIIKFVKINLPMYGLWDWEWLQVLTAGEPKTTSAGHSQDFSDTGIQAHMFSPASCLQLHWLPSQFHTQLPALWNHKNLWKYQDSLEKCQFGSILIGSLNLKEKNMIMLLHLASRWSCLPQATHIPKNWCHYWDFSSTVWVWGWVSP